MLNYETLLSNYDDKLTLMQWLKKVEAALKDASAIRFEVNKRGDATLTFSVVFEDGSTLETGPIVLQQGESVTGATIQNGHLKLTLSNGDVLDAGNLGAVSNFSINAGHLIVHYQDGTTQDLGEIFSGNVYIGGTLQVTNGISGSYIIVTSATINGALSAQSANVMGNINGGANITATGDIIALQKINAPKLTSDNSEIEAEKPIVETMMGYSFTKTPATNWTPTYVGVCKNGNKLSIVLFGSYTYATGDNELDLGIMYIPASVGAKLYPYARGALTNLLAQEMSGFYVDDTYNAGANEALLECTKIDDTALGFSIRRLVQAGFTDGKTYLFRYELTFLLSENLAA